jgi:hypothetical protein
MELDMELLAFLPDQERHIPGTIGLAFSQLGEQRMNVRPALPDPNGLVGLFVGSLEEE